MFTLRPGPLIGLMIQVGLLAGLAVSVGLGAAGWLAGLATGIGTCLLLNRAMRRAGTSTITEADRVTLARATLVGAVAALTADSLRGPALTGVRSVVLISITSVALVLDLLDGKVARRTGSASALGARFDMETDAFLLLALSCYVARELGIWVLAIGAMRYAFVAVGWVLPWLHGHVPPRRAAKVVAAIQAVVLTSAAAGVLPRGVAGLLVVASLALLVESFGHDVAWLWRRRAVPSVQPDAVRRPGCESV